LVFRILDASAFYSGLPFASQHQFFTTPLVFSEIDHIKKDHDAIGLLLNTHRLRIIDPDPKYVKTVESTSKKTGDFQNLTKEDTSAIALSLQLQGEIITDDFAVSNVSKTLGINVFPLMTSGIKVTGEWVYYCVGCGKKFLNQQECPLCGNRLRRKLMKKPIQS